MNDKSSGRVRIQPRLFKGTRDVLPEDMLPRQRVLDLIRKHAELCGFEPLMTPSIEHLDVLTGKYGQEAEHLIFRLAYKDGHTVALRYDLTVPLSRVIAMYPSLPKPFKRVQIQPVWRAEKPQKGRYREFVQCDLDTVGTLEMSADAEILALTAGVLRDCGIERFLMRINHRKVLDALLDHTAIPEAQRTFVLRTVDKLDKIGEEGVLDLLVRGPERDGGGEGGLSREQAQNLLRATRLKGPAKEVFPELGECIGRGDRAQEGQRELEQLFEGLEGFEIPQERYAFDMSLVRGLDYYTGPVFETVVPELSLGSIAGGGRYDGLIGIFAGKDIPAVGTTLGLDRILVAMKELSVAHEARTRTKILVGVFNPELRSQALHLTAQLRTKGIAAEVFLESSSLKKQFNYANKKGIPFVGLTGPDELEKGVVQVKDLAAGKQTEVPRDDLADWIQSRLAPPPSS